jgi:hypothetical protein
MGYRQRIASLVFVLCLGVPAASAATESSSPQSLEAMEHQLFWHDNAGMSLAQRLSKLEELIFGATFTEALADQRVRRIQGAIATQRDDARMEQKQVAPIEPSLAATAPGQIQNVTLVTQSPIGMTDQVTALEKAVLSREFQDEPLMVRVRRLENEILHDIVISTSEELTLRVGRLADQAEDMQLAHTLPVTNPRPFDPEADARQIAANQARPNSHARLAETQDDHGLSKQIIADERELAALYNSYSLPEETATPVQHNSHKLRHAVLGTLKTLAGLSDFATY